MYILENSTTTALKTIVSWPTSAKLPKLQSNARRNLLAELFGGTIFAVNPKRSNVLGNS
jgi:hypothetical protein